jgi:hypothetical protein
MKGFKVGIMNVLEEALLEKIQQLEQRIRALEQITGIYVEPVNTHRLNGGKRSNLSYADIRNLRSICSGLKVEEFCAKFGINEQAFYRAMRRGK